MSLLLGTENVAASLLGSSGVMFYVSCCSLVFMVYFAFSVTCTGVSGFVSNVLILYATVSRMCLYY